MSEQQFDVREHTKRLAAEFIEKGDATGWFEELYKESAGDNEKIPWADLEPNRFLRAWAEKTNLQGNGRRRRIFVRFGF